MKDHPEKATVLVMGSGGREHALAWKLSQSPRVERVIVSPGNAGMPESWERWTFDSGEEGSTYSQLAQRAVREKVSLVVVGPDQDLANGIVDVFESYGIPTFGPSQKAAQIEASKGFAKEVMKAAGVPTAAYWWAHSEEEARQILKSVPWQSQGKQWVVKADGLALGKGVRVCENLNEALQAVSELSRISSELSGASGDLNSGNLIIEEKLNGEEISWMAFCDGENCSLLEPARDYKRLKNSDQGPNTGGMGAFSPVPNVPASWYQKVRDEVFLPTLRELKRRGTPFKGLLYAGLMVDFKAGKFWVLEFNSRFGDPEAQVLMSRMKDDLFVWCDSVARGQFKGFPEVVPFDSDHAVVVVAVSQGYPQKPRLGKRLVFLNQVGLSNPIPYFYAGVKSNELGQLITSGGRVVGAMGKGGTLSQAREAAYQALRQIEFEGIQFRDDIGLPK